MASDKSKEFKFSFDSPTDTNSSPIEFSAWVTAINDNTEDFDQPVAETDSQLSLFEDESEFFIKMSLPKTCIG